MAISLQEKERRIEEAFPGAIDYYLNQRDEETGRKEFQTLREPITRMLFAELQTLQVNDPARYGAVQRGELEVRGNPQSNPNRVIDNLRDSQNEAIDDAAQLLLKTSGGKYRYELIRPRYGYTAPPIGGEVTPLEAELEGKAKYALETNVLADFRDRFVDGPGLAAERGREPLPPEQEVEEPEAEQQTTPPESVIKDPDAAWRNQTAEQREAAEKAERESVEQQRTERERAQAAVAAATAAAPVPTTPSPAPTAATTEPAKTEPAAAAPVPPPPAPVITPAPVVAPAPAATTPAPATQPAATTTATAQPTPAATAATTEPAAERTYAPVRVPANLTLPEGETLTRPHKYNNFSALNVQVQTALASLTDENGKPLYAATLGIHGIDGRHGPDTEATINAFREKRGVAANDPAALIAALNSELEKERAKTGINRADAPNPKSLEESIQLARAGKTAIPEASAAAAAPASAAVTPETEQKANSTSTPANTNGVVTASVPLDPTLPSTAIQAKLHERALQHANETLPNGTSLSVGSTGKSAGAVNKMLSDMGYADVPQGDTFTDKSMTAAIAAAELPGDTNCLGVEEVAKIKEKQYTAGYQEKMRTEISEAEEKSLNALVGPVRAERKAEKEQQSTPLPDGVVLAVDKTRTDVNVEVPSVANRSDPSAKTASI